MFLSKKPLDRRTFLRGMGATVALPLLDAMIPARALLASRRLTQRLAFVYFPHGAVTSEWIAAGGSTGAGGSRGVGGSKDPPLRTGRILEPLLPFSNRMTIVGGVENRHAYGPVHAITPGTWLSVVSPREQVDATQGATADQLAAEYLGHDTLLPSLSLAAEPPQKIGAGVWEGQFDESLATTISFRQGRTPIAMESSPRATFDRLFARREQCDGSVLDLVSDEAANLRKRLGSADRVVLRDYLDHVRDLERRVECADESSDLEQRFIQRVTLMFDLTALAFRTDITRVASLMMAAEASPMTYGHLGVPESFHLMSHHQNDPENLEKLVRIQTFHTRVFASFVRTLAELPDGDGTLLDRSLILYGSNMNDSQAHDHYPLPLAVLGPRSSVLGSQSGFGCRHVQLPDRTPMANVLLTMLRRAGVPARSFGDSTGDCGIL